MNSETSSKSQTSQTINRSFSLPKFECQKIRHSSNDSFIYRHSTQPNNHNLTYITSRTSQSIRVTRMLILVSTSFLILNAPAHLCVIALKIYTDPEVIPISSEPLHPIINVTSPFEHSKQINSEPNLSSIDHSLYLEDSIFPHLSYIAVFITQSIAYASYSINFFLYSFCGIAFRTSLRQLIHKFRRH
jgi:hypothetical protein